MTEPVPPVQPPADEPVVVLLQAVLAVLQAILAKLPPHGP
jgi:hypothetical protein